jgi:hypothetical protein
MAHIFVRKLLWTTRRDFYVYHRQFLRDFVAVTGKYEALGGKDVTVQ